MKNKVTLFMATAIMMFFAIQAQSQNDTTQVKPAVQAKTGTNTARVNFIDKNNNGICDNFESGSSSWRGRNFIDNDNNGICDNFKNRQGQGRNYVDKNNDGICDNRANAGNNFGKQCRYGKGKQYRNGQCQRQGQGRGQGQSQGQKPVTE